MTANNCLDFSCIQTYVVNLDSSRARLDRMTTELSDAGIEFCRIPAVDGRGVSASTFAAYGDSLARRSYGRPLSGGEVGCFLSHRKCATEFLATDHEFALVLEDDTYLPVDFRCTLTQLVAWLHQCYQGQWDVINLGNPPQKHFRPLVELPAQGLSLHLQVAHYFPLGTFGLLWSRSGAESFLRQTQTIYAPVDQYLRDWCALSGRGLALNPAPIGVDRSQSYIRHRFSDRLKLNLLAYWVCKNLRLLRNLRNAKQSLRCATAIDHRRTSLATSEFGTLATASFPREPHKLSTSIVDADAGKRCA